jgi:HD-GYP domain-containing protein (c-di-GMP phosphodiesterase class II)
MPTVERTSPSAPADDRLRLAELIAALSLATDLGNAMPLEWTMRTCVIALGTGRRLGLADADLADAYYATLLRSIGCTAYASEEASLFGDDIQYRNTYFPVDFGKPEEVVAATRSHLASTAAPEVRRRAVATFLGDGPKIAVAMADAACPVAVRLATRLGMGERVCRALTQIWERWDGLGFPEGVAGDEIEVSARLLHLGVVVAVDHQQAGRELACENVRRRSGEWFDPTIAAAFLDCAPELLAGIEEETVWETVLDAEPGPHVQIPSSRVDSVAAAFGDFADLKSPYTLGHSPGVARLAENAARILGLSEHRAFALRNASLLHDLGRVSVSNAIWDKPGPLSAAEWERVRLHAYYSERVLSQSPSLAVLAPLAGMHHERLDGSGYHRAAPAAMLDTPARVLAAADVYQALTEERPHRPAFDAHAAARHLEDETKAGRLDRDAAAAVLEAAGHQARPSRASWPAGLTDREVEVLRLLARGRTRKQIATDLFISESTVHTHTAHIYEKTGLSNRAGVALFSIENDLIHG